MTRNSPKSSCPHCAAPLRSGARYCGACGLYLPLWDLTWSLRRAVGGAFAAGAGWVLALGFARLVFPGLDLSLPQPLFFALSGTFVGVAGGLMERSVRMAVRGMFVGGGAGLFLGSFFWIFFRPETSGPSAFFWVHTLVWAGTGMLLGFFCGRIKLLESLGGLLWGGLGGALSLNFSLAMAMESVPHTWPVVRGIEFLAGAVLGAFLWGGVALTGRLGLRQRWMIFSEPPGGHLS